MSEEAVKIANEVEHEIWKLLLSGRLPVFPQNLENKLKQTWNSNTWEKIEADDQLDEYVLDGKSLLDLPKDNKAYSQLKKYWKL